MHDVQSARSRDPNQCVVFLGPSLPIEEARRILDADYRPPAQRGDIKDLPPGTCVCLIDGVFQQQRAISPNELQIAINRGVRIFGAASMGALRAAEVPGVIGLGKVYEMYKQGIISRDDEVALTFCPDTFRNLSVTLVNVRYAVGRLISAGTLRREIGERIISAAIGLHFPDRSYANILRAAGIAEKQDAGDLIQMLASIDLKGEDAKAALEHMVTSVSATAETARAADAMAARRFDFGPDDGLAEVRASAQSSPDAAMQLWEYGERISWTQLIEFLRVTGKYPDVVRNALARSALAGNVVDLTDQHVQSTEFDTQSVFEEIRVTWGWETEEEVHVSLSDMGLGLEDLSVSCEEESRARRVLTLLTQEGSADFQTALRCELLINDLALKRELIRVGSLCAVADADDGGALKSEESAEAAAVLARARARSSWAGQAELIDVDPQTSARWVELLARARRVAKSMRDNPVPLGPMKRETLPWGLRPVVKHKGDLRFQLPITEALEIVEQLKSVLGITRIGMIGELSDLGIQVSQAARPNGRWSSSYGSGKSETVEGAIVGGVLEEAEKWSQEQFRGGDDLIKASYKALRGSHHVANPRELGLPYDSTYTEDQELVWYTAYDLLAHAPILIPVDLLSPVRGSHDILYTARGARKIFSTNGLASGFSREEATLHALCEVIERHARKLAHNRITNPGGLGYNGYRAVALGACSPALKSLVARLQPEGRIVRALDITSEIAVPTYHAVIEELDSGVRASGWATHPNPEVALHMALLEAGQSVVASIAGGREDLLVQARSLGRHEGARPRRAMSWWHFADPNLKLTTPKERAGLVSNDIAQEIVWVLERARAAGISYVAAVDYTVPEMGRVCAVRMIAPGIETTNPYHTGLRGRIAMLEDLLPGLS